MLQNYIGTNIWVDCIAKH